jgi:hypothetical protein
VWAARRGASSIGSSPKTAMRSRGPCSSTRPPKLATLSARTASVEAAAGSTSRSEGGVRTARKKVKRRGSQCSGPSGRTRRRGTRSGSGSCGVGADPEDLD